MESKKQLQEHMNTLVRDYLPCFLTFALKRTPSFVEAEEVAQEIAYQCVSAINRRQDIENFNTFVWSIAHNTYKRWCSKKSIVSLDDNYDTFSNIASDDISVESSFIMLDEANAMRREVSRLSNLYRKTLVCFYYDELTIAETAKKLDLSEEMVKYYLSKGRVKLKEAYVMNTIGEKSFKPSDFSVYKSAIDFSKVNVWEVFKRTLPRQIALICHDNAKTISDISLETGTPAVYIEEEVNLLQNAGVMISPVKGKYRTNLFILKKNAATQIKEQFKSLYSVYAPDIILAFKKYLPQLKQCNIFKNAVSDNRYAWFFMDGISEFDYEGNELSDSDYPQILSCGSKAFIFAEESIGSPWASGTTPTLLDHCIVYPRDVVIFGEYHCQKELHDKRKAQALYDVYTDQIKDEDIEIYAELIEQGYIVKNESKLFCNVAVSTQESRELMSNVNKGLTKILKPLCKEIRENISRIVKATIPEQLKPYIKGYTETWISFYAGVCLHEILYNKGFITIPGKEDRTPVACYIYKK